MDKEEFLKKYPVKLQDLLISPAVFRETFLYAEDIPFPGIHHIRDIGEYAHFTYGSIRTSLSRSTKSNDIDTFYDEKKIKRFRLNSTQRDVSKIFMSDTGDEKDFTIAIFSFATEQEKERREARFLLQSCGFKLFAQNTYIRRKIRKEHVETSLRTYGLIKNVFLFDCPDPGTREFKDHLFSMVPVYAMVDLTNAFLDDLNNFLGSDLDAFEFSRRLLYTGPVYYEICYANEIPLPQSYFPENYRIRELKAFFQSVPDYRWKDLSAYYRDIENRRKIP